MPAALPLRPQAPIPPNRGPAPHPRALRRAAAALRRRGPGAGVDLLVGFAGVYAAFALTAYHEAQETAARRRQVRRALAEEVRQIAHGTRAAAAGTGRWLATYDSAVAAGGRPNLPPILSADRFDTHAWTATLQGGGLALLDVPTFYRLSAFYNQVGRGFEQISQLRGLSETMLLPHADEGPARLYDPATGRLRPQYGWYRAGMAQLHRIATDASASGDSLAAALGAAER
jgi:hypothetical protein